MKLILKRFGKEIKSAELEPGQTYFAGRQKECDFILEEEQGLSRKHIKIYQSEESGNWIVESLSEWGGLYLDGEEIESAELLESCSLSLKSHTFDFILPERPKEEGDRGLKDQSGEAGEKTAAGLQNLAGEEESRLSEGTKILPETGLIYSLRASIAGEFSSHISLNEGDSWIVGRSADCDISIDYSILTRKHFQITKSAGKFYVKDLGSANKTFLNGKELKPNKESLLRAQDKISVAELILVFEARNKDYEEMMGRLPALPDQEEAHPPEMALPKVVLEEAGVDTKLGKKDKFFNKKRIVFAALIGLGLFAGFFAKQEAEKKKQMALAAERQKAKELEARLEIFYSEALANLEKRRYKFCIDKLEELSQAAPKGYFKDSAQLFAQCQNGLESQRQKEEFLAQEKARQETEAKIAKIAGECAQKFKAGDIQTKGDLNQCARELLEGLDPENAEISGIRMELAEREAQKMMKEQEKQAYRQMIQSKKALYSKAKKLRDQNKPLRAVSAYNVFLKSAKGLSALKELSSQAAAERDEIQKNYDDRLNSLIGSCESLMKSGKMREAYYDCHKVLEFKEGDKKALENIRLARKAIRDRLKPLYKASMEHESFARIDEAKKLWREILSADIKGGYYEKKAAAQIKKYK